MQPGDSPRNAKREVRVETSAGGVVFRRPAAGESDAKVLLIRDAYSNWGLPKGHLEAGEIAEEAALREVREETGLRDLILGPLLLTIDWHFNSGADQVHKFCHFFLIESRSGETVPQLEEGITECVWVQVGTAVDQISYANAREVLKLAGERLGAQGLVQPT